MLTIISFYPQCHFHHWNGLCSFGLGTGAFLLDRLYPGLEVVLLGSLGDDYVQAFFLYLLLFLPVDCQFVGTGEVLAVLALFVAELPDWVEVLLEVDLPPVLELLLGFHEVLLDDVVVHHVVGDLAAQFVAEVAEGLRQDLGGGGGDLLVLFLLLLLGLLLLDLLDLELDHVEGVEDAASVLAVFVDVCAGEGLPGALGVVLDEVDDGEDEAEAEKEGDEDGGDEDDEVAGVVEGGELDEDVGNDDVGGEVLQHEDVLPALPLALDGVVDVGVEALGAPGEVVDAAEGEHLQDVDVGGRVEEVAQQRGQHLHVLLEAEGPDDRQGVPHQHEDDQRPQPHQRNDEVLLVLPRVHLDDDQHAVDHQQRNDYQPVYAQHRRRPVVELLVAAVVVVDQHPVQHHPEDQDDVEEVDHVGDGVDDVAHVEDRQLVVVELVVLPRLEEVGHRRHHVGLHRRDEGQVHGDVEDRGLDPRDLLDEAVVEQLHVEQAGGALVAVLVDVVEGEPRPVDPPPPLPQQPRQRGHRVHAGLGVGEVVQGVAQRVDPQAHDPVLSQVHVGVLQGDVDLLGEGRLEVPLHEGLLLLLLAGQARLVGVPFGLGAVAVVVVLLLLEGHALEGLPPVPAEGPRQHVDVPEGRLEGLVQHVREVVLELLGPLDGEEAVTAGGEAGELVGVVAVVAVAQLVGGVLQLQAHVAADPPALGALGHVRPHLVDGVLLGLDPHVGQDAVLGVEQFAEALEEQHVRRQLALVLVLHAEEHVVVAVLLGLLLPPRPLLPPLLALVEVDARVAQVVLLHADGVEDGLVQSRLYVSLAEELGLVEGLVDELDLDGVLAAEVLLDLLLGLVPHVVLHAEVEAQLLVLLVHVPGQPVSLDALHLLQQLDLLQQLLDADVLVVLVLEEFGLEGGELVLGEDADVVELLPLLHRAHVEVALLELLEVLLEGLAVLLVREAVLDVDLVEEADHVLGLVLAVVDLLDPVEDHHQNDLVGHDPRVVQEVLVALLDALYRRLQHVLRLRVHAHAYRQLDASPRGALEQREQSVARRVPLPLLVEGADLLLVHRDRQHLLLLELVGVGRVAPHYHQPVVLVEPDLGGHAEYLGEEVLVGEQFLVVGLLEFCAAVHIEIIMTGFITADRSILSPPVLAAQRSIETKLLLRLVALLYPRPPVAAPVLEAARLPPSPVVHVVLQEGGRLVVVVGWVGLGPVQGAELGPFGGALGVGVQGQVREVLVRGVEDVLG